MRMDRFQLSKWIEHKYLLLYMVRIIIETEKSEKHFQKNIRERPVPEGLGNKIVQISDGE